MSRLGELFSEKNNTENLSVDNFYDKVRQELNHSFENVGDYKKLEEALLKEWQEHPHWKDHDYLFNEPLNLEKLKMALALWKSLPSDPTERFLILEEIKERGAKDAGDQVYLAVQCFEKYHIKNLVLLRKHWHNCLPGKEDEIYNRSRYGFYSNNLKDQYLLNETIDNLDYASLFIDLTNEVDGRKRFEVFLNRALQEKFLHEENKRFAQRFFEAPEK